MVVQQSDEEDEGRSSDFSRYDYDRATVTMLPYATSPVGVQRRSIPCGFSTIKTATLSAEVVAELSPSVGDTPNYRRSISRQPMASKRGLAAR